MIKKESTWRLANGLIVFLVRNQVNREESIYLSSTEKKTFINQVKKQINKNNCKIIKEIELSSPEFDLMIDDKLDISIRLEKFPDKNIYYKVSNVANKSEDIGYFISSLKNEKGYFKDIKFEAAFNDNYIGYVKFICKELPEYEIYSEELSRRTKCEIIEKTKKWIPGHRYDSIDGTIYYLGSILTSRKYSKDSRYYEMAKDISDYEEVFLYVEEINESEKTITDIFKSRIFSEYKYGIKELRKITSMVDSGEVLINDVDNNFDIRDYANLMLDKVINNYIVNDESNIVTIDIENKGSMFDLFNPFLYYSPGKYSILPKHKDKVSKVFKDIIISCMLQSISEDLTKEDNLNNFKNQESKLDNVIDYIISSYFSDSETNLIKKLTYFKELVNYITSEDIYTIIKESLSKVAEVQESLSFIDFNIYSDLISKVKFVPDYFSRLRLNSYGYYKMEQYTVSSFISNEKLYELIKEVLEYSISTGGCGVTEYIVRNIGTVKKPKTYAYINLTLKDVIDYLKNIKKEPLSEEIASEIQKIKFSGLKMEIDVNPDGIGTDVEIK